MLNSIPSTTSIETTEQQLKSAFELFHSGNAGAVAIMLKSLSVEDDSSEKLANCLHLLESRASIANIRTILDGIGTDTCALATALRQLIAGILFNREGNMAAALRALDDCENSINGNTWNALRLEIWQARATILSWSGAYDGAINALLKAISYAVANDDKHAMARLWMKVGQNLTEQGDYRQAEHFLTLSRDSGKGFLRENEQAKIQLELANLRLLDQRVEEAETLISNINSQNLDRYNQLALGCLHAQAIAHNEPEMAITQLQQTKDRYLDNEDPWQICLMNMASAHILQSVDPSKAITHLTEAREYLQEIGLSSHLWQSLLLLTQCQVNNGKIAEAEAALRQAHKMSRNNRHMLAKTDSLARKLGLEFGLDLQQGVVVSNDYRQSKSGYTLLNQIGGGGFGTVSKAFDTVTHQIVALKLFKKTVHANSDLQLEIENNLAREMNSAAQLRHPNIVTPTAMGITPENQYFVVSPFIEGDSLRSVMNGADITQHISEWLFQVCEGMDYAHKKGVYHRDLKPENILIDRSQRNAMIIDFGSASFSDKLDANIIGTRPYMAPEQIKGHAGSAAMDVFAVTVMLFEIIVGKKPFVDAAPTNPFSFWKQKRALSAMLKKQNIHPELRFLIDAGLRFQPKKRPSMSNMAASFQSVIHG